MTWLWSADRQRFEAASQVSLEAGLNLTQGEPPHPETVHLLATLSYNAWATWGSPDWDTAERYARAAVAMAEELDTPVELSLALDALATVYGGRGLFRERVQVSLRRLALSHDPRFSNLHERANILTQTGKALVLVGEYAEAMPYLLEAESLSSQIQDVDQQVMALRYQALCWFQLDRWDSMLEIDEKWRALEHRYPSFFESGGLTCFLIALSASVHALRGEFDQAGPLRDESLAIMTANIEPSGRWGRDNHY
jgi:tetratricopeptide (TPR) repeat protein